MSAVARKQRRVPVDWIGLKRLPENETKFRPIRIDDLADTVTTGTTEHTPWASAVFSPEELEARIERMAARFQARMPTDGSLPDLETEQEESPRHPPCWGCGKPAPMRQSNHMYGWHHRMTLLIPGKGDVVELCCPACWVEIGERWY